MDPGNPGNPGMTSAEIELIQFPIGAILATQPGDVCRDERFIPLENLHKTLQGSN